MKLSRYDIACSKVKDMIKKEFIEGGYVNYANGEYIMTDLVEYAEYVVKSTKEGKEVNKTIRVSIDESKYKRRDLENPFPSEWWEHWIKQRNSLLSGMIQSCFPPIRITDGRLIKD